MAGKILDYIKHSPDIILSLQEVDEEVEKLHRWEENYKAYQSERNIALVEYNKKLGQISSRWASTYGNIGLQRALVRQKLEQLNAKLTSRCISQ